MINAVYKNECAFYSESKADCSIQRLTIHTPKSDRLGSPQNPQKCHIHITRMLSLIREEKI